MSLGTCLTDLRAKGLISAAAFERARPLYEELVAQYEPRFGRAAAESMATEKAVASLEFGAAQKKRQVLLQAQAQGTIERQARAVYGNGEFADGPISGKALLAHLVRDIRRGNGIKSVEMQQRVLLNEARRLNAGLLERFRRNVLGEVRHKAELDDLARALHGETVEGLNIKEMADAAAQTNEWLRSRFNAAGGAIPKLEGWGLPHNWDAYRVGTLTAEQFIDRMAPRLDRAKMIDWGTGEPLSDAKLADVLRQVYDSITSEGANTATPGQAGQRSYANRHGEHRVLHFASADEWLAANDEFGTGTAFDALMGHWERMARETAAMEVLGPNPEATVRWMADLAEIEAKTRGDRGDRAAATVKRYEIEKVWAELSGENMRAVRKNAALFGSSVRNFEVASKLGGAFITALSDHATRALTNSFNGMAPTTLLGQYLKQMLPIIGSGDRSFARRHLVISDEYAGRMAGIGRFHMDDAMGGRLKPSRFDLQGAAETTYEVSRRMSDAAMRLTLLSAHTIAGREVAAMEFVANLSHHAGRSWAELGSSEHGLGFKAMLERHGIGPGQWDTLRAAPTTRHKGMDWLLPENIADAALREAVLRMQFTEIDLAIPTGGAYQAALTKGAPAGTVLGEGTRFALQFKMFPLTVVAQHAARMMAMPNWKGRAGYAAAFLGSTTVMGALATQVYELYNGRDPLPMTEWSFWTRALQKAGGLGVFGDAVFLSRNEYGQSLGNLVVGPAFSTGQNVATAGWAGAASAGAALTEGEDDDADAAKLRGRAMKNLLARETPVLNTWYTRLAWERLFVDTMAEWAAGQPLSESYRAQERYANERGTSYWAPPGTFTGAGDPMREPDLANAFPPPE